MSSVLFSGDGKVSPLFQRYFEQKRQIWSLIQEAVHWPGEMIDMFAKWPISVIPWALIIFILNKREDGDQTCQNEYVVCHM